MSRLTRHLIAPLVVLGALTVARTARAQEGIHLDVGFDSTGRLFALVTNIGGPDVEVASFSLSGTNAGGDFICSFEKTLRSPKSLRTGAVKFARFHAGADCTPDTVAHLDGALFAADGTTAVADSYSNDVGAVLSASGTTDIKVAIQNNTSSSIGVSKVEVQEYDTGTTPPTLIATITQNVTINLAPKGDPSGGDKTCVTVGLGHENDKKHRTYVAIVKDGLCNNVGKGSKVQ